MASVLGALAMFAEYHFIAPAPSTLNISSAAIAILQMGRLRQKSYVEKELEP